MARAPAGALAGEELRESMAEQVQARPVASGPAPRQPMVVVRLRMLELLVEAERLLARPVPA
jgi:hypothetical protein